MKRQEGKERKNERNDFWIRRITQETAGFQKVLPEDVKDYWPTVMPSDDSQRLPSFTREQEARILDTCGQGEWRGLCLVARYTGLRYGDVARLRWDSISDGVIRLTPSKTSRHGIQVVLPLPDFVIRQLPKNDSPFVFPDHAAAYPRPVHHGIRPFADILKAAGVEGRYTFHSWRHTFRTRLAEAGVPDDVAKRLGGWTEDSTALRYDHGGRVEELRKAVEATIEQPRTRNQ